jgi:hypothetical protein
MEATKEVVETYMDFKIDVTPVPEGMLIRGLVFKDLNEYFKAGFDLYPKYSDLKAEMQEKGITSYIITMKVEGVK